MHQQDLTTLPVVLVVAFGTGVMGINPGTGRTLWTQPASGPYFELLVTADRILVAGHGELLCLQYPSGQRLWTAEMSAKGRATLVTQGGLVFVGVSGEVNCFTLEGQRLWVEQFKGKGMAPVTLGFPANVGKADVSG